MIDDLSKPLLDYSDVFSPPALRYGEYFVGPFNINVPAAVQLVHSHPYRSNPTPTKTLDAILSSYLPTRTIHLSTLPWTSPLVSVSNNSGGIFIAAA